MIPLRDTTRSTGFPFVTVGLIALNAYVFWLELTSGPALTQLIQRYALVPAKVSPLLLHGALGGQGSLVALSTLVTATFLHASWVHILANMLYLWVFGDNVENRLGPLGYLSFYLFVGVVGNVAHVMADPSSMTPTLGASGAIAGVLGAYFLMFPRARVLTLIPLGIFFTITEVRATFFLLIWFGLQLISGLGTVGSAVANSVAWWAHIGGFTSGMVIAAVGGLRRKAYG